VAKLSAFRALRYNPAKVQDLGKVVAPPYDILSPKDQAFYYARSPYNIVRLDFGKARISDSAEDNKYTRAAALLKRWRAQGVLLQDAKPALYVTSQTYQSPAGETKTFVGVYASLKLEPYRSGVVRPHEKTLSKPKADRLELTKATQCNFSPIFFLCDDRTGAIRRWMAAQTRSKPSAVFKTAWGESSKLWVVDRPTAIQAFIRILDPRPLYIADGHHRYETMLRYAQEAPAGVKKAAQETLACLAPFQSRGLLILPTHRLVHGLKHFNPTALKAGLAQDFELTEQPTLAALQKALGRTRTFSFGLLLKGSCFLCSLKKGLHPEREIKERRSRAYKTLDVSLLQALVLEKRLGMTPESIAAQEGLLFEKSASKSQSLVETGKAQAAFIINATKMEQLKAVSDAKDVMPQKSTYFLPKLITGVVLRALS
jgi:uncharacterized protein (DUF1015 family)